MADQATPHRRRVPLKASRDEVDAPAPELPPAEPKAETKSTKAKSKGKAKAGSKPRPKDKKATDKKATEAKPTELATDRPPIGQQTVASSEVEEPVVAEVAAEPKPPGPWKQLKIRWGVVLLVGPVLVLTPLVLTWATLAIFSPIASYFAAFVKSVREDKVWSVLGGLLLGLGTAAGLTVLVLATFEAMGRRRTRLADADEANAATAFALTATAAVALVCTPLALFFGSTWLSSRAESDTDISKLFFELDASRSSMRTWVIAGLVVGTGAAIWAARTHRLEPVKQRTAKAFDEWAAAKYDNEINPDKW